MFYIIFSYDLKNTNINDSNLEKMPLERVPDVVLVIFFTELLMLWGTPIVNETITF